MENASKALIIAGAILLSILLISLGIMIFTQAQDVVSGSGMTEAQVTAFNNKFIKYEGNQKGTMVKSLIQEVLATNSGKEENDGAEVKIQFNNETATASPTTNKIVNNNTYAVEVTEYATGTNRISTIKVSGTFKS